MKRFRLVLLGLLLVGGLAAWLILRYVERSYPAGGADYSLVEDGLYMGGNVAEPPPGTRAVLNLCRQADRYRAEVHVWKGIPDAEPAPSLDWLREAVEFVDAQRRAGRTTFVHCRNGVSRSGMVVVAYLMARHHWDRDRALAFLRSRRPGARPNPAFMERLSDWQRALPGRLRLSLQDNR
jgi:hypothetical protein